MKQYRAILDSEIISEDCDTLVECIRVAEKLADIYNTNAVIIEGYKTGDLTLTEAKKITDYDWNFR